MILSKGDIVEKYTISFSTRVPGRLEKVKQKNDSEYLKCVLYIKDLCYNGWLNIYSIHQKLILRPDK